MLLLHAASSNFFLNTLSVIDFSEITLSKPADEHTYKIIAIFGMKDPLPRHSAVKQYAVTIVISKIHSFSQGKKCYAEDEVQFSLRDSVQKC